MRKVIGKLVVWFLACVGALVCGAAWALRSEMKKHDRAEAWRKSHPGTVTGL